MLEWSLFRIAIVAAFIVANAFFVAAEFALVSVRETRVEQLLAQGRAGARAVLHLKHTIDEFLPAVQFGVTLAALALGWVGEPVLTEMLLRATAAVGLAIPPRVLHPIAIALAFATITYFEVLLGELVPKSLALQRAERIALAVAPPMDAFIRLTRPAVRLMNASATLVLRFFRAPLRGEGAVHSPEELKLIATATRRMGLLPVFQEEIIHRAIELNHVTVREIMTPRARIFLLPADLPIERASARIIEEQHSRVPVFETALRAGMVAEQDRIIGMVFSKDVSRLMHFRALAFAAGRSAGADLTLRQIMRPAHVVPETKLAVELLQEFQQGRRQIAIVVDEFGSTVGLVTAEDALEQIVGELEDEFDLAPRTLPAASHAMRLDGATPLRDLTTQLHWNFPREAGVETLAGFLLAQLGRIPVVGDAITHDDHHYAVVEMQGRRIARVLVTTAEQTTETAVG